MASAAHAPATAPARPALSARNLYAPLSSYAEEARLAGEVVPARPAAPAAPAPPPASGSNARTTAPTAPAADVAAGGGAGSPRWASSAGR